MDLAIRIPEPNEKSFEIACLRMKRRGIFESTILNKSFLTLKLNMLLINTLTAEANYLVETSKNLRSSNSAWQVEFEEDFSAYDPVSYTHLTLPTKA